MLEESEIMDLGSLRKEAKEQAKADLIDKGVTIYREELKGEIAFNVTGIKESINQPFSKYIEKIELIKDGLENALRLAQYIGYTTYQTHHKGHVLGYHYFATKIGGNTAYFNIQFTVQRKFFLYSITETIQFDKLE